ncbi:MAG: hypothetical protein V5A38_10650 [Halolamina sp.]|uniref:DUF7322 domain-containing protein n=1 Tax=Halolamina sp. TaxID=1940283 RepID=UPI002FC2BFCE
MSDGDDTDPGTDAEQEGVGLGPKARDLAGELAERRRERFGATAADVPEADSESVDDEPLAPPESDAVEVDSETARSFWAAVVYVNVGLFVLVLGLLLAGFRGRTLIGAALVGGGALALYRAWTIYRAFEATRGSEATDGDDADAGGSDVGTEDAERE